MCSKTEDNLYFKLSEELVTIQIPSIPVEARQTDSHFPQKAPDAGSETGIGGINFNVACKIYLESSPLPCLAGAERNIWIFLIFFTCTFGRTVIGRYRSQDLEGIPQNGGRLPPGRQEITNGHIRGVISLHFGHHFRYHAGHCDFPLRTG